MIPVNSKIIVQVNPNQKDTVKLGDTVVKCAYNYEVNYRIKSPVIGIIVHGNEFIKEGSITIFHHNNFYLPSPYHLQDDLFSVPFGKTVFGTLNENGDLNPLCGNILCKWIDIETTFPLPPEQRKKYIDRYEIINPTGTIYKKEQIIFTRPHSGYEIVYIWNGIEKKILKVHEEMVCGLIK